MIIESWDGYWIVTNTTAACINGSSKEGNAMHLKMVLC